MKKKDVSKRTLIIMVAAALMLGSIGGTAGSAAYKL